MKPLSGYLLALLTALSLAPSTALAHLPHDEVTAVAVPPDMNEAAPWFLVVNPGASDLLLRSDDGGWMWEIVGGDPTMDRMGGGTMLTDGTPVFLGEQGVWWSPDGGETWNYDPLPEEPFDVSSLDDEIWIAGPRGLRHGRPGLMDSTELTDTPIVSLHEDGGILLAVAETGDLYKREYDGTWTELGTVGDGVISAAWDRLSETIYAADDLGDVYAFDGKWRTCGELPAFDHPFIYQMAVTSKTLLVTPGDDAPYVSLDGCRSWQDASALLAQYDVEGGVAEPEHAYSAVGAYGSDWYVSGWDGWARTDDAGATWAMGFLVPVDYTRGLEFSPDFETSGRAYIGGYAAGPIVAIDGGADYISTGYGLYRYNSQKVYVPPDDPDTVYAIVGHSPWRSDDAGLSWTRLGEFFVPTLDFNAQPGDEVWLVGTAASRETTSNVARSYDKGDTWEFVDSINGALLDSVAAHVTIAQGADGDKHQLVLGQKPVRIAHSIDDGVTWELIYEGPAGVDEVTEAIAWPVEDATAIVAGVGHEMVRSDDWGDTWVTTADLTPDTIMEMEGTDDGTIVAGLQSGRFVRSNDGGETWQDLGVQLNCAPRALAARPNFATHDVVLIGSHDGVFAIEGVNSDTPTIRRWGAWQVVDEASQPMLCETCPGNEKELEKYPGAARDEVIRVQPDMVLRTVLRGSVIRVLGAVDASGNVTVEVGSPRLPGDFVTLGGDTTDGITELARFDLEEGWHEVEIRGVTGTGVVIDAVEGISDQPPLAYDGTGGDTGDGGSADGGSADGGSADGGADGGSADGGSDTGDTGKDDGCGNCAAGPGSPAVLLLPALLALTGRRRRG